MVYIDSWDEYVKAVEQLCLEEPSKVRIYCIFWQISDLIYAYLWTRVLSSICWRS